MPSGPIGLFGKVPGGPPVGDACTITCYTCGMPSSKEWAQRVRSRPSSSPVLNKPYYPFLLQLRPPPGAVLHEDGSAFLCAFCHASVEAQWNNFEKGQGQGPINCRERVYNVHKFVCAVCSVETYRKRVRALPFQEFPFLSKDRQPGSLTLGNNPLAIVCLDCSETLWSQSAEYDRWGLPVQKRHFNWMLRQPPPENSIEATVARLPSGETQVPRCPPTEPRVFRDNQPNPLQNSVPASAPTPSYRVSKTSRAESYNSKSSGSRKSSTSSIGPMELGNSGQTVPIVTVAPWASHHNAPPTTAIRKDSITIPTMSSANGSKYDTSDMNAYLADHLRSNPDLFQQQRGTPPTSVQAPSFLPTAGTLGSYHWGGAGGRDIVGEPFHFQPTGLESRVTSTQNTNWTSWLPPSPQADLLRYQSYLSSIGNRSFSVPEAYYSPSTHGLFPIPTSTEAVAVSRTDLQSSPYNIPTFIPTSSSGSPQGISHSTQTQQQEVPPPAHSSRRTSSHSGNSLSSDSDSHSSHRRTSRIQETSVPFLRKSSLGKLGKIADHRRTFAHINPKKGITKNNFLALAESEGERLMNIPMGVKKYADRTRTENSELTSASTSKLRPARTSWPNSMESLQMEPINYSAPAPVQRSESAMDLSVPAAKSLNQPKSPSASVPRRTSNFLISYLCGESNSTGSDPGTEKESRDSVIVTLTQNGSPKPVSETPLVIPEPVLAEKPDIPEPTESIRSESSESESMTNHKPESEPEINSSLEMNGNKESEVLKTNQEECMEVSPEESVKTDSTFEKLMIEEPMVDVQEIEKPKEFVIVNEKEFVENAIQEFRKHEEENLKASRDAEEAKKGFLVLFNLITNEQKSEIELKTMERRFEMKSLPPLKLMPKLSPEQKVNEELEKKLFMTVFEDASLKQGSGDPEQVRFMSRLGLKQASRTEKYRCEHNWRIMLTERMLREKRGANLVGPKRPWDNYLQASKHLLTSGTKLARRHSTGSCGDGLGPTVLMRSLSVTLPPVSNDFNRVSGIHSADLLTTVESRNHALALKGADSKETNSILREPVITYPKYIPSYALGSDKPKEMFTETEIPETKETSESETSKMPQVSVLNVPMVARSFAVSYEDILLHGQGLPIPKRPLPNICKIPVIGGNMKSNLSTDENTTPPAAEDGPERKPKPNSNGGGYLPGGKPAANNGNSGRRRVKRSGGLPWPGVDSIIQRTASQWKDTKEEIESVMKQAFQIKAEDRTRKRVSSDLKRLRKSLSSQQAEMKVLVKRLKRK